MLTAIAPILDPIWLELSSLSSFTQQLTARQGIFCPHLSIKQCRLFLSAKAGCEKGWQGRWRKEYDGRR
jgi:hypothetical protein